MRKKVFSLIRIVILVLVVGMVSASAPFDIVGECPGKFTLDPKPESPETDKNGDGYVCSTVIRWICNEIDGMTVCVPIEMEIDNNVRVVPDVGGCPDKFTLDPKPESPETDKNGDGYVCSTVIRWLCQEIDGMTVCVPVEMEIDNNVKSIDK